MRPILATLALSMIVAGCAAPRTYERTTYTGYVSEPGFLGGRNTPQLRRWLAQQKRTADIRESIRRNDD